MGDQNVVALARGMASLLVALIEGGSLTKEQAQEVARTISRGKGVPDGAAMAQVIHERLNRIEG